MQKRKGHAARQIPKAVYVIVVLALLIGIILGIGMNLTPVDQEELMTQIASPIVTSDSDTVDLPELQTQWAELGVTKTAVNESNATPTPN